MTKPKLFLIDLSYARKGRNWSIIPLPLSIANVAAYTQKLLPDAFEISLFKDPNALLAAIETERPDLAAFSNYIWNKNLQLEFARHLKDVHPTCVTIMGGPNYNFTELDWVEDFARSCPQIDYHIEGEGEGKFANIAACCREFEFDRKQIDEASPAGATFISVVDGRFIHNTIEPSDATWSILDPADLDLSRGRLRDLDDIPSPYLTGLLDDFLADPDYCPIIETNRGCPYSCTFCNWGAMGKSKSASFSMDRVIAELEYISEKNVSRSPFLYIGDANFGLFARDVEIAEMLRRLKVEKGFPQNVYLYYAKNSSEKVVRIAEILKGMSRISLSRQTQNDQVLENIKRSNISIDTFNQLSSLARELGVDSFVELIYTLPGESKDSFLAGVRNIMENDVDALHFFPAMLLHGSEMGTRKSRAMFGLKGEWRAIDGCAGEYGPVCSMEYEEIITSSAVMTREEHFEIRIFHFLQTIILDTKFYKEIVWLTGNVSIIDVILNIMANYKSAEKPFRELIDDFIARAKAEFLKQPPSSWSSEDIAQRTNASVKLNPLFTVKLLYDPGCREAFHRFMIDQLASLCGTPVELSTAVFEYLSARLYPFDGEREHAYQLHLDLEPLLSNRQGSNAPIAEYLLHTPKTFLFRKDTTYQEYLNDWPTDTPLPDRLYDIVLHHSHEKPHQTLVSRFAGEATGEHDQNNASSGPIQSRVLQLEGGWLY